jgi:deoxyribose-phosphate aldolase
MNNLEKSMQMQTKKGKMKSKLAGNIQNQRQANNILEAGNTQNLNNG